MHRPLGTRDPAEWAVPAGLERSAPRPVALSRKGKAVFVLAIASLVFAVGSGVVLGSMAARGTAEARRFREEAAVVQGVVLRKWQARGRSPRMWIAYRFDMGGETYRSTARMQRAAWRPLEAGAVVTVRYLSGDPAKSIPDGAEPSGVPAVVPVVVSVECAVISVLLLWQVARQRRLLEDGRVCRGVVTEHGRARRNSHGREIGKKFKYTFPLLSGAMAEGKGGPEVAPPPVGGSIPVLYDADNPGRNAPYPLPLVRPGGN